MRLAVDLMGSDASPYELIEGVAAAANFLAEDVHICVMITPQYANAVKSKLEHYNKHAFGQRLSLLVVDESVQMEDSAMDALKEKPRASVLHAVEGLKSKGIDGYITAGNSGALIAAAALSLNKWQGIDRPALLVEIPTLKQNAVVIDVGASVQCRIKHLLQYAAMGVAYYQTLKGVLRPRVGVLNVGSESNKGQAVHKELYQQLSERGNLQDFSYHFPEYTFVGNVEGRDIFLGNVDVLVTDGFSGNLFLKSAEGACGFLIEKLRCDMKEALAAKADIDEHLTHMQRQLSHFESAGALLCGIDGLIFKCPGIGTASSLQNAILRACEYVKNNTLANMRAVLHKS